MAVLTTNKEIAAAVKRSKASQMVRATEAKYVPSLDVLVLQLTNGTRAVLPREQLQGLQEGSRREIGHFKLVGGGSGLYWPELDVDLSVEGLVNGIYGTRQWMSTLGRMGGSVRSKAKSEAARRNGLKGGRPKLLAR